MYISKIVIKGDHDESYTIEVASDGAKCSCPAYRYGGGTPCKHIRYVAKRVVAQNS